MTQSGCIRVGMGGWSYAPWRETFYPQAVKQKDELHYASRQVTAIEVNSTFYRLQKPSVFAKWRDATPAGFVFAVKAPRFIVQRKVLADAGESIERFIASGVVELGEKLGPILWQLAPTHAFDAEDLTKFLQLLPQSAEGVSLRHALNVRHASFASSDFLKLAREHGAAAVFEDDPQHPSFADLTADFVYARLRRSVASQNTGYSKVALGKWAKRAHEWARGAEPKDLPYVQSVKTSRTKARDVFVFFINGAKERAPAAACELLAKLDAKVARAK